jgi:hypothetical protein
MGGTAVDSQIKRDNFLRNLAFRPRFGLEHWREITADERLTVLKYMRAKYDDAFAQQFMRFANAGARSPGGNLVSGPEFTPDKLQAKGFRYVGDPGGVVTWTRPNGEEVYVHGSGGARQAPTSPAPPPPPPAPMAPDVEEVRLYLNEFIDQRAELYRRSLELGQLKSQLPPDEYARRREAWIADYEEMDDDMADKIDNVIPSQTGQLTPIEAHERQMLIDQLKYLKGNTPGDFFPPNP